MHSRLRFCFFAFLLFETGHSEGVHDILSLTEVDGKIGIDVNVAKDSEEERALTALFREVVNVDLKREPEAVLQIGCGNGADSDAFTKAFANASEILGVDINETEIEEAQREYTQGNIQFRCVDMADSAILDELGRYDLVIMRHPEPFRDEGVWIRILSNAKKLLSAGGFIVITTYAGAEVDFFVFRKEGDLRSVRYGRNPFFRGIIQNRVGRDLYYAVFADLVRLNRQNREGRTTSCDKERKR